MSTKCRFSSCNWTGTVDDIFPHCETYHAHSIREHKNGNYYDFTFDDLTREAFLLSGKEGIYWFCLDLNNEMDDEDETLKRGIFHIGESEPIQYTLKLGMVQDGHADILGPHDSQTEQADRKKEVYDLEFPFTFLEHITTEIPSRHMRLYVGEYDDSDDVYAPDCDECSWSEEDERINKLCIERFTCCVCLEYIRRDVRFCERHHFVCLNCFDEMTKHRKLRCPICRGNYPYDCHDPRIERFIRMIKFPDHQEQDKQRDLDDIQSGSKRFRAAE